MNVESPEIVTVDKNNREIVWHPAEDFCEELPGHEFVQQAVAQIPRGHIIYFMEVEPMQKSVIGTLPGGPIMFDRRLPTLRNQTTIYHAPALPH